MTLLCLQACFGFGDNVGRPFRRQRFYLRGGRGIRQHLQLNKPIYQRTAAYGHFGRAADPDGGFSWEKTDRIEDLKSALA